MTKLVVFLGTVAFATGCLRNKSDGSIDSADSAVDSYDSTNAEGNIMMAAVDGSDQQSLVAFTDVGVAARIAANVALRWPSGCATAVATGATVAITYDNCTGPRGLVHVTGELDLAVSVTASGAIAVHGTSTDLSVNGATLDIDADATYAVAGSGHSLSVTTHGTGVGPRGNTIDHDGQYTLTWDTGSECGSIEGHWQTEIGSLERSNDVDLSACANKCPSGSLTHHYLGGASLTVDFDGTATATWSTSVGGSGTVKLGCTAE